MKKLLILKAGSTFPSIKKEYGDFEDFITRQLEIDSTDVIVNNAVIGEPLPSFNSISGIIITGSHSMVSDREEWSENLAEWLKKLSGTNIPTLGICYGHQLLAHAFGGSVDYHPGGKEFGLVDINLTGSGKEDKLLSVLGNNFTGYAAHSQSVLKLPADAVLLAENDFETHHAFSIGENIWGVQFHPEFNAGITRMYINELKDELLKENINPLQLINSITDSPTGKLLLKRFYELAQKA